MNVQKIDSRRIMPVYAYEISNSTGLTVPKYGLKMTNHLYNDTVSFQGKRGRKAIQAMKAAMKAAEKKVQEIAEDVGLVTEKELPAEQKIWKINKCDAEKVHEMALKPQSYIRNFIHNLYDDLVYSEKNKRNPILEIHNRSKSVDSIIEKSATRKWSSVKEILDNMTDLNGVKIVTRKKAGKDEMDFILDRLIPMIKTGQLELKEIEIKRPESLRLNQQLSPKDYEKYDYASMSMLKKLVEVQEGVWNTKKHQKKIYVK